MKLFISLALIVGVSVGQFSTSTFEPTTPSLAPTDEPTMRPTTAPSQSPTIKIDDGEELVIIMDVTVVGGTKNTTLSCSDGKLKKKFRNKYEHSLLSIFQASIGASEDEVNLAFIGRCEDIQYTNGSNNFDTGVYGFRGATLRFKLSSDNPRLRNTLYTRFEQGYFIEEFNEELTHVLNRATLDSDNTEIVSAESGKLREPDNVRSAAERFASWWLLPGLSLIITGFVFLVCIRSDIDRNNMEENARIERMQQELDDFEKRYGTLDPADAVGDMVEADLPPNENITAVEMAETHKTPVTTTGGNGGYETKKDPKPQAKSTNDQKKATGDAVVVEDAPTTSEKVTEKPEEAPTKYRDSIVQQVIATKDDEDASAKKDEEEEASSPQAQEPAGVDPDDDNRDLLEKMWTDDDGVTTPVKDD